MFDLLCLWIKIGNLLVDEIIRCLFWFCFLKIIWIKLDDGFGDLYINLRRFCYIYVINMVMLGVSDYVIVEELG